MLQLCGDVQVGIGILRSDLAWVRDPVNDSRAVSEMKKLFFAGTFMFQILRMSLIQFRRCFPEMI